MRYLLDLLSQETQLYIGLVVRDSLLPNPYLLMIREYLPVPFEITISFDRSSLNNVDINK
jgi:hypothetical protein